MRSFEDEIKNLKDDTLYRQLRSLESPQGVSIRVDDRELLNFSSNDYLGLAASDELRDAFHRAIDRFGTGAGASRLVSGTLAPHRELEEEIARFKQTEAALSFSSGYAAAVGTLGALLGKGDAVILDKLSHASLIDAARLSGAAIRVFPHNDLDQLENRLRWARDNIGEDGRVLVITESVFSMDGDLSPLAELAALKDRYGALLLVDEAHAVGVLGPKGQGLAAELGLVKSVDVHMGTLSKAAGVAGGYIAASRLVIDLLINRARSFIYSTAPPPALAATASHALQVLASPEGDRRRETLWRNISLLHRELMADQPSPPSPIIPWLLHDEDHALRVSGRLMEEGVFVPAIRYPTVARGAARLRITLSAAHTPDQIVALSGVLKASVDVGGVGR